jgi:acyl carrier protein
VAEDVPDLAEITALVAERVAHVMALPSPADPEARFEEDLQADSLDLVEVIETVERDLAARGLAVALADDELLDVTTVGDAARRIHAALGTDGSGGADGA